MSDRSVERSGIAAVTTMGELAQVLRWLRRRLARTSHTRELTYREIAARTGWSHTTVAGYFNGQILAPTDRFDELIRLLGALPDEQRALATARDRVAERRRATAGPTAAAPSGPPAAREAPVRQLPAASRHFAARGREIATLDGLLLPSPTQRTGPAIAVIRGTAGVGKTALAVHWAHRRAEAFPDGQLYLDLHGFAADQQPMPAPVAVVAMLEALLPPGERMPALPEAQLGLYRSLLADSRMLLVLDNARDVGQVRPLLPPSSRCAVLVTSRDQLTGLVAVEGATPLGLGLLDRDGAYGLLAHRLEPARLHREEAAIDTIITSTAGLPLALCVVAARAESQPGFPLATIAGELVHARSTLDAYADPDPAADLRAVLSWSYRTLGTGAARLFRLLAVHPGPDITEDAAASLVGQDGPAARSALRELARASLLDEYAPGRFAHHELLRAYAGELTRLHDDDAERAAAVRRVLDHYLHVAYGAERTLNPHRAPIALPGPAEGTTVTPVPDPEAALAWFAAERTVLLRAQRLAGEAGLDVHAWQFAWTLSTYLHRRGEWHDVAASYRIALDAAERLGDLPATAVASNGCANAAFMLGDDRAAAAHWTRALTLWTLLADPQSAARAHRNMAALHERLGDLPSAVTHAEHALDLYRKAGSVSGQGRGHNAVGWYQARLGRYGDALGHCRRALALLREVADEMGEAAAWDSLGYIYHQLGYHRTAAHCFAQALRRQRRLGDRLEEATTLSRLGDTWHAAGAAVAATRAWRAAVAILDVLGHRRADAVRARLASHGAAVGDAGA